jgi:hypothetical protein
VTVGAAELEVLRGALEAVLRLVWLRLEERGVLAAGGRLATLEELLRRPVALDGGEELPPRSALAPSGPLARLAATYELSDPELVAVVAALAPELDGRFDVLYDALADGAGPGGLTGEALRALLGRTLPGRLAAGALLAPAGKLRGCGLLRVDGGPGPRGERVRLDADLAAWLCGRPPDEPQLSADFPALRLRTVHRLGDLVLPADVRARLVAVLDRIASRDVVLGRWGFAGHHDHAAGFHVLFHGPPGTGKTLAAAVLGAETGLPVYRIDLSLLVSKYIGETEKNLARVFELAEARGWILFFDEADALFGRRGEVSDARDRYANQEVSYLLQRLETFTGVSVLATNLLRNVDEAFLRRIHAHVSFPIPDTGARERLWRAVLPPETPVAAGVDIEALADAYELTGAEIRNAAFHAAHRAAADGGVVLEAHLREGVRAEYEKNGRMFPAASP